MLSISCLGLGGENRGIGHNDGAAHDGVNATLIGIAARRQAGDRIGAARLNGIAIEDAPASPVKTFIVGDGMVSRSRIVPPYCGTGGHGNRSGYVVRRTAIHEDLCRRWGGRDRPGRQGAYCKTQEDDTPAHRVVNPVNGHASIIHRDRFDSEGLNDPY